MEDKIVTVVSGLLYLFVQVCMLVCFLCTAKITYMRFLFFFVQIFLVISFAGEDTR